MKKGRKSRKRWDGRNGNYEGRKEGKEGNYV